MTGALVPGRALWRHGVHPRPPRKTSSSHSPGAPPGRCRGRAFYSAWRACARNVPKTHRSKPRDSCHRIHFNARVLRRCFVGQHSSLKSLSRSPWLSRGRENKDQRSCRVTVGSRRALTTPRPFPPRALGVPHMPIPGDLCHVSFSSPSAALDCRGTPSVPCHRQPPFRLGTRTYSIANILDRCHERW